MTPCPHAKGLQPEVERILAERKQEKLPNFVRALNPHKSTTSSQLLFSEVGVLGGQNII